MFLLALAVLLILLTYLWMNRPVRPPNFPPGPPTFLIFGNIKEVFKATDKNTSSVVDELTKIYGDISSVVLPTGELVVHLMKFEDVKEMCANLEFSGRRATTSSLVRSYMKQLGLIFNQGSSWVEHRRFALKHLRDLGFGKSSIEDIVRDEFEFLTREMESTMGKPLKINSLFNLPVLNVLWSLVASQRFSGKDQLSHDCIDTVRNFFSIVGPQNVLDYFPWLRFICPKWCGYSAIIDHREFTADLFRSAIRDHLEHLDPENPRDFFDVFLREMKSLGAEARDFTEENLTIISMDLFLAGMETTSTSLSWAVLFMIMFPEVQCKVHQELDEVVGSDRLPSGADKPRLPYTCATIMEITRRATVVPRAVGHTAIIDTQFKGYNIPKGTLFFPRIGHIHMDPEHWGDPENFRPERFLNVDGTVRNDDHLIPFGIGKRSCLGESLARQEMYLFFTALLQRYRFAAVAGDELTLESKKGVVSHPSEFRVDIHIRKTEGK